MASNKPKGPSRSQSLKPPDDVNRNDLQGLVEANPALAEEENARLDRMRQTIHQEVTESIGADQSPFATALVQGAPTWEQVKKGLTPEVLGLALKFAEPTLLLVPPTTRQSKVEAINKHPAEGQKAEIYIYKLQDHNLWNGGKSQTENKWRVSIVEGIQDVEQDNKIYNGKRTNFEMSKRWVKNYEDQGQDVINDADTYFMLVMKGLADGKPIDSHACTVLNGKNLTSSSLITDGSWNFGVVYMDFSNPYDDNQYLRLRGLVRVDVQS